MEFHGTPSTVPVEPSTVFRGVVELRAMMGESDADFKRGFPAAAAGGRCDISIGLRYDPCIAP